MKLSDAELAMSPLERAEMRVKKYPGMYYWTSFTARSLDDFECHLPWWVSGSDMDGNVSVCCAIPAESVDDAMGFAASSFKTPPKVLPFRFVVPKEITPDTFGPDSRFELPDWAVWPRPPRGKLLTSLDAIIEAANAKVDANRKWATLDTVVGSITTSMPWSRLLVIRRPHEKRNFIGFELMLQAELDVPTILRLYVDPFECVDGFITYSNFAKNPYKVDSDGYACLCGDLVDTGVPTIPVGEMRIFLHPVGIIAYKSISPGVWEVKGVKYPGSFVGDLETKTVIGSTHTPFVLRVVRSIPEYNLGDLGLHE